MPTEGPLSEAHGTVTAMRYHPWRAIRALTDVTVRWEPRSGLLGGWCARTRTLVLHPDQTQAERRCTAAHELVHIERGDVGECDDRTERLVHEEAARRLIPIRALAEQVVFYEDDHEALAEALWVDQETLRVRIEHLHPSERGLLKRALAMKEQTA